MDDLGATTLSLSFASFEEEEEGEEEDGVFGNKEMHLLTAWSHLQSPFAALQFFPTTTCCCCCSSSNSFLSKTFSRAARSSHDNDLNLVTSRRWMATCSSSTLP